MSENKAGNSNRMDAAVELTEYHKDLAQLAHSEFLKGNYAATYSQLAKLQTSRPKDVKVLLNKSVAEYYKSGLKKTDVFTKNLLEICAQAGIKLNNSNSYCVEASVLRLNHCIVWYYLQGYKTVSAILEDMFQGLQTLEENVSVNLCLLLAECYLEMFEPSKTMKVVNETEAAFLPVRQTASGSKQECDKDSKSPEGRSSKDLSRSSSGQSIPSAANMISNASNEAIGSGGEMKDSAEQELLRAKLQMLRTRAVIMMRLHRQFKKEMKALNTQLGNQQNLTLLMIKALLECLKGSHRKAIKFLNQCATLNSSVLNYQPKLNVAYYNNLAVIHFYMGKPTLATLYLTNSLQELSNENKTDIDSLPLYSRKRSELSKIDYNLGIVLLSNNQPSVAFDYLLMVIQSHPLNTRLWLRLAECCIAVHKMQNVNCTQKSLKDLIKTHYKTKDGHKIISLTTEIHNHDKKLREQQHTTDAAVPVPTLEFARLCLRNALYLLPDEIPLDNFNEDQENSSTLPTFFEANPSEPMRGQQAMQVKLSCLTCSAYVGLCLGDYTVALRYGQTLLSILPKMPRSESDYKFLGHLYCGEALVKLGRITEAVSHFDPQQVGEINLPAAQHDITDILIDNRDPNPYASLGGSIILRYNLSVAYALRGQYQKANNILKEICSERKDKIPTQFILLAIYIHLQLGHIDTVESILKKHTML